MRRFLTPALIVAGTLSQPLTAFAQDACPPGAWFCAANDAAAPSGDVAAESDAVPPPPQADSLAVPDDEPAASARSAGSPPVVVYQSRQTSSPSPQIVIIAPGGTHIVRKTHVRHAPVVVRKTRVRTYGYAPAVRPIQRGWRSEWGLNARVEGVSFGDDRKSNTSGARDAGMGGFGLSLRYRPWARFAIDAGFDVIGGTDFNGFERVETPFSVNGMFYFNPRSRTQFYVMGGVNWSSASVRSNDPSPLLTAAKDGNGYEAEYKYFGGQLGMGLEFRLTKRLALNVDFLGFMRSRTDIDDGMHHRGDKPSTSTATPEFIDPENGQTSNKSGGGLFRGGLTLWW